MLERRSGELQLRPYSDDVGQVSRADAPSSSLAMPEAVVAPAVRSLVDAVPRSSSVLPSLLSASAPLPANNNAQRTAERVGVAPYAAAGTTTSGDTVFAGAALAKGRDAKTGAEAEVLSISAQVGAQSELQAGLVRVGGGSGLLAGSIESMTVRANVGIHNDDGSTGLNLGVGATALGAEATLGSATSASFGLAASVGAGASIGIRDLDKDGYEELCGRLSVGALTVGLCVESPL